MQLIPTFATPNNVILKRLKKQQTWVANTML
jgi:hypothetical protein